MKKSLLVSLSLVALGCVFSSCTTKKKTKTCTHIDENHDHICDKCSEKLSDCKDENSDHNCDYCGKKISSCKDGNNDHYCDTCLTKISECIDEDKNHYCDICNAKTSHCDVNIDGTCDICEASWSDNTKTLFNNLYGELLPYFQVDTDFTVKTNYLEAVVNEDATKEIKSIFLGTGKYSHEESTYLENPCDLYYKVCANSPYKTIRVQVIYNGAVTYVDADYINTVLNEVPAAQITSFLATLTTVSPVLPTDGTKFGYEQNSDNCYLFSNGDSSKYLTQLKNASYYVDETYDIYQDSTTFRAISPERTLAVEVSTYTVPGESIYQYQICYFVETKPTATAWPTSTKNNMETLFGEELPFVNANFSFGEITDDNLVARSTNIDAFKYAVDAFTNAQGYSKSFDAETGIYTFIKDKTTFFIKVNISVSLGETTIRSFKAMPTSLTWPGKRILDCFDIEVEDTIPAAEGTFFKLYYEDAHPNIVIVTVKGTSSQYTKYISDLETAGYDVTDDTIVMNCKHAVAPNKTVEMYVTDYTDQTGEIEPFYTVEIQAKTKPTPQAEFPLTMVNAELSPLSYTGPIPTGTGFAVSYPYGQGSQDVMVSITGGDKTAFVAALEGAGFNYDSIYSYPSQYIAYTKPADNLAVYIYNSATNTDYDMEIGIYSYF